MPVVDAVAGNSRELASQVRPRTEPRRRCLVTEESRSPWELPATQVQGDAGWVLPARVAPIVGPGESVGGDRSAEPPGSNFLGGQCPAFLHGWCSRPDALPPEPTRR